LLVFVALIHLASISAGAFAVIFEGFGEFSHFPLSVVVNYGGRLLVVVVFVFSGACESAGPREPA